MGSTFTKLTYHCAFSTKDRVAHLCEAMRPDLHAVFARSSTGRNDAVIVLIEGADQDWATLRSMARSSSVTAG